MTSFLDYLNRNQPEYSYRIKCLDDITALQDELEQFLSRYKLIDISKIKKTIFHKRSLDFPDQENVEIFFVDIVTALPVSKFVLAKQLSEKFYIDGKRIVVRTPGEPTENYVENQETQYEVEQAIEAGDIVREPLLSTESSYPEEPESISLYGDAYNESYLDTIKKLREKQREEHIKVVENPLSRKPVKDFENVNDFNSNIKDGPVVKKLKAALNQKPKAVKEKDLKKAKLNSKYSKNETPKEQ